jgi:hypothetical protein
MILDTRRERPEPDSHSPLRETGFATILDGAVVLLGLFLSHGYEKSPGDPAFDPILTGS